MSSKAEPPFATVSIHASAWEATGVRADGYHELDVSIHASAWEATPPCRRSSRTFRVSIHASAWEATLPTRFPFSSTLFQSTPPRGRRPKQSFRLQLKTRFNPRLRVGGDL